MAARLSEDRAEVIERVREHAKSRLKGDQAELFLPFVGQLYGRVAAEDLASRTIPDLYGAALALLHLAQQRPPGEPKVAVYSPDFDEHGFASPHTVVEVVTDDMPFLVDSITMEVNRHGLGLHVAIHPVIAVRRDAAGALLGVLPADATPSGDRTVDEPATITESYHHIEVDRQTDPATLDELRRDVIRVLGDVRAAVTDWKTMRERALSIAEGLDEESTVDPVDPAERTEAAEFLRWLAAGYFTFLGYREYELVSESGDEVLRAVPGTGLGLLQDDRSRPVSHSLAKLPPEARSKAFERTLLNITKANSRSTVHRNSHLDYVGVKQWNADGRPVGERRFLGLYAKSVYKQWPSDIPILRRKVRAVLDRAAYPSDSHNGKALIEILDSYPRDELFQTSEVDLYDDAMAILELQHRQQLRLLVRRDDFGRYFSCQVYLPLSRLTTSVQSRMRDVLMSAFHGVHAEESTLITESVLARLHLVIYTGPGGVPDYDVSEIEARLTAELRSWNDDLYDALIEQCGEEQGVLLYNRYADAFPSAYRDDASARTAVSDIRRLEDVAPGADQLAMHLYRPLESPTGAPRLKLYRYGEALTLSDVLPLLENMGMRVVDERPYEVRPADGEPVWVYDFGLQHADHVDLDAVGVRERFQQALAAVWRGDLENDPFNRLVLRAGLSGREVSVLRAYAKYLRQIGTTFSQRFMAATLANNPGVAGQLVELFRVRFDPELPSGEDRGLAEKRLVADIERTVDAVASLNEDRVLRSLLSLVRATLRTNHFQLADDGRSKPWLSLKLDPHDVPDLPLPRPMFEIFVYSPRTEGVHLRGGKVARGGLRWSDRPEDFRTEVLGLMKAQNVKNAVIVPFGAKGGFVVKSPPPDREALMAEVVACYRTLVSGLLDLTDNLVDGQVVPPPRVVRHDGDDPYLVVAADKGTATFSDIANGISRDYGFWLGDAFASGGSHGYDHKAMGITARGAWVSVRRHFRALGTDVQNDDFTVAGIGDMSGDVFGNGMLLSRHIRLVAAFDHRHIFLDPDPDAERSFAERARLFALPRSSWADYDQALISSGGAVVPRTAKVVTLSPEVRAALDIDAESLTPDELIRAILKSPVDLLWNGGIGTYVKASTETNAEVGDKNSDSVRINATELRCKVVGEGGNLGFTQRGRIEYALHGGHINTDAIDNSAGVDCSDHEVNIKILLDRVVSDGDLTGKQRDALLVEMTDEVAAQVLGDNDGQTRALYTAAAQSAGMRDVHVRYLDTLERSGRLDRELEVLPTGEQLRERANGAGLTIPEFSVLLAYTKIALYDELLASDVPEDRFLSQELERYFPSALRDRFGAQIRDHRLRREIIATCITNSVVNRAGTTFAFRLSEETGSTAPDIARAHTAAREIFGLRELWAQVEALDDVVATSTQISLFLEGRRLVERSTRWLLRNRRQPLDIAATVEFFKPGVPELADRLPELVTQSAAAALDDAIARHVEAGVPEDLARQVAALPALFSVLDITEVADSTGRSLSEAAAVYFALGQQLRLDWLRDQILVLPRDDRWSALARAAFRDDLHAVHASITAEVLRTSEPGSDGREQVLRWLGRIEAAANRCLLVLDDIAGGGRVDLATLSVALREIRGLIQATAPEPG